MFGFGKKKKKEKQRELDAAFSEVMTEIDAIEQWEDPNKIHRYILESCEQIISRAKIIKKEQAEYEVLTKYLKDIKRITDLDEREKKRLSDMAKNVVELEKTRLNFQQSSRRLSEEQFALLEENEKVIPETVATMTENERYQDTVRRDMQALEAKKSEYEIELSQLEDSADRMRMITVGALGVFATTAAVCLLLQYSAGLDTIWAMLVVGVLCAFAVLAVYFKQTHERKQKKNVKKSINKTISMLNVVRMKYANVTTLVEYEKDKYGVMNAYELNYLYERYLSDVRDIAQYEQDNHDYVYFNQHIVDFLNRLELYDSKIWLAQIGALIHPEDMKEINHKLVLRRKKVRAALEENTRFVKSERDEVTRLMREHDYYEGELIEIIATIDEEMGWNKNYQIIKAEGEGQEGAKEQ